MPPLSELTDKGENVSSWLGSTPASTDGPDIPATSPPLSAVPSGVTCDQLVEPAGRWSNCQKVFSLSDSCPSGSTTHEPEEVAVPLRRGGWGRTAAVALGTAIASVRPHSATATTTTLRPTRPKVALEATELTTRGPGRCGRAVGR